MNRPFPAFAALLILMTLAVMALSAGSRSTSVSQSPQRKSSATGLQRGGSGNFVFVVPGAIWEQESAGLVQKADVAKQSQVPVQQVGAKSKGLDVVTVVPAERIPGTAACEAAMDCRSHYDRAYDSIVHGAAAKEATQAGWTNTLISSEDIVVIFQQLGPASNRTAGFPFARASIEGFRQWWQRASSAGAAARLWIVFHIRRLTTDSPLLVSGEAPTSELSWNEYDEQLDRAISSDWKAIRPVAGVRRTDVLFSDWLRHSAAPRFSVDGAAINSPAGRLVP